jgi:hypothetical protein
MRQLRGPVKFGVLSVYVDTSEIVVSAINFRLFSTVSHNCDSWCVSWLCSDPEKYVLWGAKEGAHHLFQKNYPQRKPLEFRFSLVLRFRRRNHWKSLVKKRNILRLGCERLRIGMNGLTNRGGKSYILLRPKDLHFG